MAPEQLEGKDADARTDIFAFGAIIYEMITGKKTFEGASQASLIAAILDREPPPMSADQPLTPPSLDRVVKKCLAKNPDDRWQAAGDLSRRARVDRRRHPVGEASESAGAVAPNGSVLMWAVAATVCWPLRSSSSARDLVNRTARAGRSAIQRHDAKSAESPGRHDFA